MATSPSPPTRSRPLSSRNPLPLSAAQEAQVQQLYHKRVRDYCADEIREFAQCAAGRTVSATWACRQQRLSMNSCMLAHAGPKEEDLAREEYFAGVEQRVAAKKERECKAAEAGKFHREWWDLDENGLRKKRVQQMEICGSEKL